MDAIDGSGVCAGLVDFASGAAASEAMPGDDPRRVCSIVWEYDNDGGLSRQLTVDAMGRAFFMLVYTDKARRTAEFKTEEGDLVPMKTVATTIHFERIEDGPNRGQDRLERYTDASGQACGDLGFCSTTCAGGRWAAL